MSFKMHLKFSIKLCIELLLRLLLRVFYLFPVKSNQILFNGNCGHDYSGNPKYIFEKLFCDYKNAYDMYWVVRDPYILPAGVKYVKMHSCKMAYIALTSKILVVDDAFPAYLPFRKKQVVIDTWHGGGAYKKIGRDFGKRSVRQIIGNLATKHISIFLSTNKRFTYVTSKAMGIPESKFWEIGMPREDILFHTSKEKIQEIRKRIHLAENQKLALYAPTFRGYAGVNECAMSYLDIEKCTNALSERWPGEWVIGIRYHTILEDTKNGVLNYLKLTDYPDMQELLCVSNVLITDYSSCMWDASLMKKPCFILAPDRMRYTSERDFYTPMEQWPFPIASTNEELFCNIKDFDSVNYEKAVELHHQDLEITETGCATDLVADAIYKISFKNCTPTQILGDN